MKNRENKKTMLWLFLAGILVTAVISVLVTWQLAANSSVSSADGTKEDVKTDSRSSDKITILYTSNIYCSIEAEDDTLGFADLAALKSWAQSTSQYVTLVDCGDAIQGEAIGTLSDGEYMVELMNEAGYDICTFGNHEFDYGIEQILEIAENLSDAEYISCNFMELASGNPAAAPYVIMDYDGISVAYVGISSPETITTSVPKSFMDEDGSYIYGFCQGEDGTELYAAVQSAVDAARAEGADYVIAMAHLGNSEDSEPYRSTDVIANTTGIDVMLDGHSLSAMQGDLIPDKEGKEVLLSSTGNRLANVGCLTIDTKGTAELYDDSVTTTLISNEAYKNMNTAIGEIQSEYEEQQNTVVAHSDVELSTLSGNGNRIVRSRETNIGDLCADAYRIVSGADIAVVNGGGIRAELSAGDITYGDIINVHPYGNRICVVECSGQEILDMLEMAYSAVKAEYEDENGSIGESGGFQQISGMTLVIDTGITSSVVLDENGMFVSVSGERRVKDVKILNSETGEYEDIDPEKTYTLASHNYMLHDSGDGFSMFTDNTYVMDEFMLDHQVLISYITDYLDGTVGTEYETAQGRIVVR